METLTEIKNNYAKELDYEDWRELQEYHSRNPREIEAYMNEICIRAQKAALKKASENVTTVHHANQSSDEIERAIHYTKHSITNPENLIL